MVWAQYMKCDGLPDPACVRELNTYLTLWKEDEREDLDSVLARTQEVQYKNVSKQKKNLKNFTFQVLPILSTLETLIENPEEWEVPVPPEEQTRSYKTKIEERSRIFYVMKSLQLTKLNRATYNLVKYHENLS